ncbi:MAG: Abi family protein [Bacteroidota bacterium]
MQDIFGGDKQLLEAFKKTLSESRLTRYIAACGGDSAKAIDLYYWNSKLGETFHLPLQMWEVALRNQLNSFLCWKYKANWPFDDVKGTRQLSTSDRRKVHEAIERQRELRKVKIVPTGAVVANLSAGFWVSLLGKHYDLPFVWRHNLKRVFPAEPSITRDEASAICDQLLDLRNRVAHHEPIFHLPLEERRLQIDRLLKAMCPASHHFANVGCAFSTTWKARPHP